MREECGIFGIHGSQEVRDKRQEARGISAAQAVYLGLFALQHRGQESCGIAVSDAGVLRAERRLGLVCDSFDVHTLAALTGENAIGHVLYGKINGIEDAQPIVTRYAKGRLAVAVNGGLCNADELRDELAATGALFQTTSDTEIIAQWIIRERMASRSTEEAVMRAMQKFRGEYTILALSPLKLIAARDPLGFRPLWIGKLNGR